MTPAVVVASLWLLFGGTHVGLAAIRGRLVARLGEVGFTAFFYAVASVSFAALVTYYAAHRFAGLPGLGLGRIPALRWPLMGLVVLGLVVCAPALAIYPRLPSALFGQPIRAARGIARVTRHPFFVGTSVFALAHVLLAPHLAGTVFFGGLLLLAAGGAWHQDRKLLARHGPAYASYLAETSALPFAAIVARRQTFVWRELEVGPLAVGLALALAARHWHDALFAAGGMWIVTVMLVGAMVAGASAWRRSRRSVGRTVDEAGRALPTHATNRGGDR